MCVSMCEDLHAPFWYDHSTNTVTKCYTTQTAPLFTWDSAKEKFLGPMQKSRKEQDMAKALEEEGKKQVI